ncbi:MAG: adenylosuccinate synthetase [Bacteroidota bacterium]
MKSKIILGLGYGDEGKGLVTAYHAEQAQQKNETALVIRFSGGQQAGHTVVSGTQRHVFSSFGSGTLADIPTYWSSYCTFDSAVFWREGQALKERELEPIVYVDGLAPVTTPYDVFANRSRERDLRHGSCGMGVGATYARMEGPYKLFVQDLMYPEVLKLRLAAIRKYYENRAMLSPDWEEKEQLFLYAVSEVVEQVQIIQEQHFFSAYNFDNYIFEGSQGILLDMDHGFFPHVTRSRTSSCQALELIRRNGLPKPELYYVTRAYQTRHGNGPLTNETLALSLKPTPLETNQYNEWQGEQRRSVLDAEMLNYALQCDANYAGGHEKHLVVTCLDQLKEGLSITVEGERFELSSAQNLSAYLNTNFKSVMESWSDRSAALREDITAVIAE